MKLRTRPILPLLLISIFLTFIAQAGCSCAPPLNNEPKGSDNPGKIQADPREALRVEDAGQRVALDRFLLALTQADIAAVAALMTEHARKEAETQYGTLDAYVLKAQANMRGKPVVVSPTFPHLYQRPGDEGSFIELHRGSDSEDVLAAFMVMGPEGPMIDNLLSRRVHIVPDNAPALGMSNSIPQGAFLSYYFGASVLQHPTPYLIRRIASGGTLVDVEPDALSTRVVSREERFAYLRQSCTPEFIALMRKDPLAENDIEKFLEAQRSALKGFFLPRFSDEKLYNDHVDVIMASQDGQIRSHFRFLVKRMHGQCKLDKQEEDKERNR